MAHPLFHVETPWYGRPWASIKRNKADLIIILVTLLVIAGGILGLILLPGQVGTFN
jgi:hypothetical protein